MYPRRASTLELTHDRGAPCQHGNRCAKSLGERGADDASIAAYTLALHGSSASCSVTCPWCRFPEDTQSLAVVHNDKSAACPDELQILGERRRPSTSWAVSVSHNHWRLFVRTRQGLLQGFGIVPSEPLHQRARTSGTLHTPLNDGIRTCIEEYVHVGLSQERKQIPEQMKRGSGEQRSFATDELC